jgi:hypothetical protein
VVPDAAPPGLHVRGAEYAQMSFWTWTAVPTSAAAVTAASAAKTRVPTVLL